MQVIENQIMQLKISDFIDSKQQDNQNPILLFLLEGEAEVIASGVEFLLHPEDFLLINSNEEHSVKMIRSGLIGMVIMNHRVISDYVDLYKNEFNCNSLVEKDENRRKMQRLLREIFSGYYKQNGMESILLNATFYRLFYQLCMHYLVKKQNMAYKIQSDDERRYNRILSYLQQNYNQTITLADLAEETYFSTAYLSRYIKKKMGKNFIEALTDIRLAHAVQDIITTDKTFMKVALDNGFPSTVAFNKAFKKTYNMTPSEYQKSIRQNDADVDIDLQKEEQLLVKIKDFLDDYQKEHAYDSMETYKLDVDLAKARPLKCFWNRMINGGQAKDLLRADMQQHILLLKEELCFEYVRFWDIYAPAMFLHKEEPNKRYNFSKLDTIFDFLCNHRLHPYIELGFKPIELWKNVDYSMVLEEREIIFRNMQEYAEFLHQFLKHCINRYGMEEVEQWYFEQWMDTRYSLNEYFEVFGTAYAEIKSFSPNIKVGGAGLNMDDECSLAELICQWRKRNCYPDFVSIYSYPYERNGEYKDKSGYNPQYSRNQNYMQNYLDMARQVLHENGFWNQELHISEWNFTVSNRNCLNDSTFKGAYIIKNLLDAVEKADIVGYWFGSDLFSEYYDSDRLLDGSGGLLTKDGIRKPAFYGISFMNRLGNYILGKNDNSIVTSNLRDTYSIICHYYEHPNYKYFIKEENKIHIAEKTEFFDNDTIRMRFRINGIKNGTYTIKTRTASEENGSVQDEWMRMGLSDNLNSQDVMYLRQICVPRISIETSEITDSCMELEAILHSNEIQHISIYFQM